MFKIGLNVGGLWLLSRLETLFVLTSAEILEAF